MARQGKGAVARAKQTEWLLIVAFALSASEAFFIYRNFRLAVFEPSVIVVPFFGGFVSVCLALLACVAMLVAYVAFGRRVGDERHLNAALVCSLVGPLAHLLFVNYLGINAVLIPSVAVTSVGCACYLPAVVFRIVGVGVRCAVRSSVGCCLALLVLAPVSMIVPVEGFALLLIGCSVGAYACLRALGPLSVEESAEGAEPQKLPRILMATIVVASMLEGVVAALDEASMGPSDKMVVFSLAFVASAALCAIVLLHMRGSFNNALYRICIPLMAAGLSVLAIDGPLALDAGSFLVLTGRQLFAATILALVVYLARYHGSDYYLLVFGVLIGAMVGNLAGLVLYQAFGASSFPELMPGPFVSLLLFFVLTSSLYLMNASNLKTHWGMTAIDDTQESVGLTLDQSCEELASRTGLTEREKEVVMHIVRGRDRQAIAEKLFISEGTVKVHMRNIYQKLDIHSKQELIKLVEDIEDSYKE